MGQESTNDSSLEMLKTIILKRMRRWWWWSKIVYKIKPEESQLLKYKRRQPVPEPVIIYLHYIERTSFRTTFELLLYVLRCCFPSTVSPRFFVFAIPSAYIISIMCCWPWPYNTQDNSLYIFTFYMINSYIKSTKMLLITEYICYEWLSLLHRSTIWQQERPQLT
jgi:hypothetical protein